MFFLEILSKFLNEIPMDVKIEFEVGGGVHGFPRQMGHFFSSKSS